MNRTTFLMILFVTVNTTLCQLILKKGVLIITRQPASLVSFFLQAAASPYVWLALMMQGVGYGVWMLVISRVQLGVAFTTSGAFFNLLLALSAWLVYGEKLRPVQWLGIIVVSFGVFLISLPSR